MYRVGSRTPSFFIMAASRIILDSTIRILPNHPGASCRTSRQDLIPHIRNYHKDLEEAMGWIRGRLT